jgi:molybdopterin/thiamine biosynthesis adenylyltransferase
MDFDIIKRRNLNRLAGGTAADAVAKRPKVEIARRVIKAVNPHTERNQAESDCLCA